MYAIEFETDITDRFIEIKDYESVANKHAKVIILVEDEKEYPSISKEEAEKRVSAAVERYEKKEGKYLSENEYKDEMENFFSKLESKNENS